MFLQSIPCILKYNIFYGTYFGLVSKTIIGACINTGRFKMFSVITNNYNKKTKGPTLMEIFTATGKLIFF